MTLHRFAPVVIAATLASSVTLLAACGSSSTEGGGSPTLDSGAGDGTTVVQSTDAAIGDDGGALDSTSPADAGPLAPLGFPAVINGGDPQPTSPKVVTITFKGDTMATQLATFGEGVTKSSWWSTIISDYCQADGGPCVGQTGVAAPINANAGASYVDTSTDDPSQLPTGGTSIWDLLTSEINGGTVPKPDANTLYVFYFPSTTKVNLDGDVACGDYDGYHNQVAYTPDGGAPTTAIYAVVMECQGYALSDVTLTSSHEIAEAATDGYFSASQQGGWYLDTSDLNAWGWDDVVGGEVADLCVDEVGVGQDHTMEGTFTAQRIWSVTQASLGKDPCVPARPQGDVYFNAKPEKALFVMDVGQTRTFKATAFADGTTPSWTLTPQDWTDQNTTYLQVTVNGAATATVSSGTVVDVSVTLVADPGGSLNGEADGVLLSTDTTDSTKATKGNYWPFVVLSTADAADAGITEPAHPVKAHRAHRGMRRHADR